MDWRDIDDPKKERAELLKAIAQKPSAELYYKLGTVYENVKDFKKAIFYGKRPFSLNRTMSCLLSLWLLFTGKKGIFLMRSDIMSIYWNLTPEIAKTGSSWK